MTESRHGFSLVRLAFGLAVIVSGVVLTLDNLGLAEAEELIPYWPVLLIAVGITAGFSRTYSSLVCAALTVGVGSWLLLYNLGYVEEEPWSYFWPAVLIVVGVNLLLGGLRKRSRRADGTDSFTTVFAFMSGHELKNSSADFQGADLTAIMGGCELDLRGAKISGEPPVVRVLAFWGGIEIKVPREWRVESRALPLLGGYEDNTESSDPQGPVVVIKGAAIMGGIEIGN